MASSFFRGNGLPRLLLVEPDSLIRSTVAGVCKQLGLAQVHQANSVAVAEQTLRSQGVDLMLISLNQGDEVFDFLEQVRGGWWADAAQVPIAVTAQNAHSEMISKIRSIQVKRLLLQPYKIRDVVHTVEILCAELKQGA